MIAHEVQLDEGDQELQVLELESVVCEDERHKVGEVLEVFSLHAV